METKITVRFASGMRRVLKSPDELGNIEKQREAGFVMNNLQVFQGYCDGDVDDDGNFSIMSTIHGVSLPFNRLLGWFYISSERKKSKRRK
ncbi:MAG: hypothetical protein SPI30_08660 [Prevotella sp.]|nr:hypothetical protein [Prevotella sp.]